MDINTNITKRFIKEYIDGVHHLRVEPHGQQYRCRVGDRSHIPSMYTSKTRAELALIQYVGEMLKGEQKRLAKRKANAKKSKS